MRVIRVIGVRVIGGMGTVGVPDYVTGAIRYYYRTLLAWHTTVHLCLRAAVGSGRGSREDGSGFGLDGVRTPDASRADHATSRARHRLNPEGFIGFVGDA